MQPNVFPRRYHPALQDLALRVLESRPVEVEHETLARDLLSGFHEVCRRAGLDGVLAELTNAFDGLDVTDGSTVADHERLRQELTGRLGNKAEFDPRGPRNSKPKQLADCLLAACGLSLFDPEDRSITFSDDVRREVIAALNGAIEPALAIPQVREAIIAAGRAACEERHHKAYDKIVVELDERGQRILKQLKLSLDAVQHVQRVLVDARVAVVERAVRAAIDAAKQVLARANPEAAERLDQPVTHELTPRQVVIVRAVDPHASKAPEAIVRMVLDGLSELAALAWEAATQHARPYAVSQTYAVGELVDHPKFGRGTVKTVSLGRIEVAFPEGTNTLVHARNDGPKAAGPRPESRRVAAAPDPEQLEDPAAAVAEPDGE